MTTIVVAGREKMPSAEAMATPVQAPLPQAETLLAQCATLFYGIFSSDATTKRFLFDMFDLATHRCGAMLLRFPTPDMAHKALTGLAAANERSIAFKPSHFQKALKQTLSSGMKIIGKAAVEKLLTTMLAFGESKESVLVKALEKTLGRTNTTVAWMLEIGYNENGDSHKIACCQGTDPPWVSGQTCLTRSLQALTSRVDPSMKNDSELVLPTKPTPKPFVRI